MKKQLILRESKDRPILWNKERGKIVPTLDCMRLEADTMEKYWDDNEHLWQHILKDLEASGASSNIEDELKNTQGSLYA